MVRLAEADLYALMRACRTSTNVRSLGIYREMVYASKSAGLPKRSNN